MKKNNKNSQFYGDLFNNNSKNYSSKPEISSKNTKKIKKAGPTINASRQIYSIKEINNLVKNRLENEFSNIWLEGEISNSTLHSSGHYYFSLKDEDAQLRAVMFKSLYNLLKFTPKNGMKILVKGNLTCFVKGGSYQINAIYMEPQGIGSLQLAFEQLKERLFKEGLFDQEHKKPIPMLPQKIGIVTSPTGAAIRDILSVLDRRYANINIILYPVRVQGDEAKFEIVKAIKYFDSNFDDIDVLLVGRGGGSMEDLWAFNEEMVARSIFESKIPIISCIGHEIDFVISDFVADLRAPTPSAAAEIVVKDKIELINNIYSLKNRLNQLIFNLLDDYSQSIDYITEKCHFLIKQNLDKSAYKLGFLNAKLINLSPDKIIQRGYSIVKNMNNKIVDLKNVKIKDKIKVMNKKVELVCEILNKHKK